MTAFPSYWPDSTRPEPFDWQAHNAEQDRLAAELAKALDAWRETASSFMRFDPLAPRNVGDA